MPNPSIPQVPTPEAVADTLRRGTVEPSGFEPLLRPFERGGLGDGMPEFTARLTEQLSLVLGELREGYITGGLDPYYCNNLLSFAVHVLPRLLQGDGAPHLVRAADELAALGRHAVTERAADPEMACMLPPLLSAATIIAASTDLPPVTRRNLADLVPPVLRIAENRGRSSSEGDFIDITLETCSLADALGSPSSIPSLCRAADHFGRGIGIQPVFGRSVGTPPPPIVPRDRLGEIAPLYTTIMMTIGPLQQTIELVPSWRTVLAGSSIGSPQFRGALFGLAIADSSELSRYLPPIFSRAAGRSTGALIVMGDLIELPDAMRVVAFELGSHPLKTTISANLRWAISSGLVDPSASAIALLDRMLPWS